MPSSINHSGRAHAILSASSADRWINCAPSARLNDKIKETAPTHYADEGTLAHEYSENELRLMFGFISKVDYLKEKNKLKRRKHFLKEMPIMVQRYCEFIVSSLMIHAKAEADVKIEERLSYTDYAKDGFGTVDFLSMSPGVLQIIDFKYGKGVEVSAHDNSQLKTYALGAYQKYDLIYGFEKVEINIVQPRISNYSTFTLTIDELISWGEKIVKPAAKAAWVGVDSERKAGSWCRWCKVKPRCPALAKQATEAAIKEFTPPEELSDRELSELFKLKKQMTAYYKALSDYMLSEALQGKKWEGLKLVEGRSARKFTDKEAVKLKLLEMGFEKEDFETSKLNGIIAISNLMSVDDLNDNLGPLIIKPPGAPTLVDYKDKRKEFNSVETDFSEFK